MTTRPAIDVVNVDASTSNIWNTNLNSATCTVKNIGLVTVYMRQVVPSGLVNTSTAYPILPGETVYNVPNGDADNNNLGFNTLAGTSKVAIICSATV